MKVLVTGATGLVGAHSALELLKQGYQVRMLVRNPAVAQQWFSKQGMDEVELVKGDMLDAASVENAMQGCQAVIHAAAIIDLSAQNKEKTIQQNLQGVDNVIGIACRLGLEKIVYVSSITVIFGANQGELNEDFPITQNQDPYTQSKTLCEERVRELQQQGYPIIITYPSGIFGPDDPKLSQSNEGLMLLYRDFVPLTTSGMQIIDARDLAIAHRLLLEAPMHEDRSLERYVVGGHFLTWKEFAGVLRSVGRKKVKAIYLPGALFRGIGILLDTIRKVVPINYPVSHEATIMVTQMPRCSSARLLNKLDMRFRPIETTFKDTLDWLYQEKYL